MKIIAHRGNLNGPDIENENNPKKIDLAISENFDAEIDVWYVNSSFFLGHDRPLFKIDYKWLTDRSNNLWCHAKNFEAIVQLSKEKKINYFWHENDKMTLTSMGIPWCYPENFIENGVTVSLEKKINNINLFGVCTDYPIKYRYF
jgi:hypothetical protein